MNFLEKISDLITHLNKYKDAVIFIGNNAVKDFYLFQPTENNKNIYCRKQLVKEPKEFWDFYKQVILRNIGSQEINKAQIELKNLINQNIAKTLIDFNSDGFLENIEGIEYIPIKGNRKKLFCSKCGKILDLDINKILNVNKPLIHSEYESNECNGRIIPTIPFYGNNAYNISLLNKIYDSIFKVENKQFVGLNTHTLIFVGADFNEDLVFDLLKDFTILKKQNPNEKYYSVIIADHDETDIEFHKVEFATTDDIDQSLSRLIKLIKGE